MTQIVLHFAHAAVANQLVAGIPAAARAAHQVALRFGVRASEARCVIAVPGGWEPSAWCRAEMARLAPDLAQTIADSAMIKDTPGMIHLRGELCLRDAASGTAGVAGGNPTLTAAACTSARRATGTAEMQAELRSVGKAIVAATGKPGDGIVSRHLNRPVSQAITRAVLRFPAVTPFHATLGTAFVALLMAACLFLGGSDGLIAGALLFQAASIVDGVDGEIARATFRSSARGAMLDSLVDACTNLVFIAGLTFNLWRQGHEGPAVVGAMGLAMLAAGLVLLGLQARARGGPFTFDALKDHFRARPSRLRQWLTWLTMRDFYAAAAAVLILFDLATHLLVAFTLVATGWFAVTLVVICRAAHLQRTGPAEQN